MFIIKKRFIVIFVIFVILVISGVFDVYLGRFLSAKDYSLYEPMPPNELENGSPIFNPNDDRRNVVVEFIRPYGFVSTMVTIYIRAKTPHGSLYIKELSFERNGRKRFLLKNMYIGGLEMDRNIDGFYYVLNQRSTTKFRFIDNLFSDMEIGDVEDITVRQVYKFYNEPVQTQYYTYEVKCFSREREKPWFFQVSK